MKIYNTMTRKKEEFVPNDTAFKACRFVRQDIFRYIGQEGAENIVEGHEIQEFRCIILVNGGNHVNDKLRDIGQLLFILPQTIKSTQKLLCIRCFI